MRWTPDRLATRSESGASGQHILDGAPVVARMVPAVTATAAFNLRMSGRWGIRDVRSIPFRRPPKTKAWGAPDAARHGRRANEQMRRDL